MSEIEKDVHTEHCCSKHGCKYGHEDCPVWTGAKPQSFPCEYCGFEEDALSEFTDEDLLREVERRSLTSIALRHAAENAVIAYGMGWDMAGVIEALSEALQPIKGITQDEQ